MIYGQLRLAGRKMRGKEFNIDRSFKYEDDLESRRDVMEESERMVGKVTDSLRSNDE